MFKGSRQSRKKKKSVTFVTLFLRGGGGSEVIVTLFYFMLKMAYNSSRNAKKILGRGGANPLNCHTKWVGGIKKKSVTNVTLFFIFYFDGFP